MSKKYTWDFLNKQEKNSMVLSVFYKHQSVANVEGNFEKLVCISLIYSCIEAWSLAEWTWKLSNLKIIVYVPILAISLI